MFLETDIEYFYNKHINELKLEKSNILEDKNHNLYLLTNIEPDIITAIDLFSMKETSLKDTRQIYKKYYTPISEEIELSIKSFIETTNFIPTSTKILKRGDIIENMEESKIEEANNGSVENQKVLEQ